MKLSSLCPVYIEIGNRTLGLIEPLSDEDCCVQSMLEASPVKWHLAHTAWFFENFILQHYEKPFKPFHEAFSPMFSSYNAKGQTKPDSKRGLFTRPSLGEVRQYCHDVDERMNQILSQAGDDEMLRMLTVLGMNHEQQHQELMLTDVKHLLSQSPLDPCYRSEALQQEQVSEDVPLPLEWHHFTEGVVEIGHQGDDFSYDNESPRHKHYLQAYQLASRLITNGEYLQFMESGGYENPKLWLSEGMDWVKANGKAHPLYWRADKSGWKEFTLRGLQPLDLGLPVIHVSFYEADAFARCLAHDCRQKPSGKMLPPARLSEDASPITIAFIPSQPIETKLPHQKFSSFMGMPGNGHKRATLHTLAIAHSSQTLTNPYRKSGIKR